jgi:hypothetical protein
MLDLKVASAACSPQKQIIWSFLKKNQLAGFLHKTLKKFPYWHVWTRFGIFMFNSFATMGKLT